MSTSLIIWCVIGYILAGLYAAVLMARALPETGHEIGYFLVFLMWPVAAAMVVAWYIVSVFAKLVRRMGRVDENSYLR